MKSRAHVIAKAKAWLGVLLALLILLAVEGAILAAGEAGAAHHNTPQSGGATSAVVPETGTRVFATLVIGWDASAYAPGSDGSPIPLPAGSVIELCALDGATLVYDHAQREFLVARPCDPRAYFFKDGFE